MDWYMFTPAEHEYFHYLETGKLPARVDPTEFMAKTKNDPPSEKKSCIKKKVRFRSPVENHCMKKARFKSPPNWRLFGDKLNLKTNTRRRYFKCTFIRDCPGRVVQTYNATTGKLQDKTQYADHCSTCYHFQQMKGG